MHVHTLERWHKNHDFFDAEAAAGRQRRVLWVVALTAVAMVVEIGCGMAFGSMALLADGWHMASHAAALGITVFAYAFARRHVDDARFTFGPWEIGVLGGFASAVVLAVVAILLAVESVDRLVWPVGIAFNEAIVVAVVGLVVNLLSAWMLHGDHHGHDHQRDHNLKAAYAHVLADALTSVLAIVALIAGELFGWVWMDAVVGIVGAIVIGRWSLGMLRDTGRTLLDADADTASVEAVRTAIEADADNRIADLHVWRVGPNHLAAMVSLVTHTPQPVEHYKSLLSSVADLVHVTIEVHGCDDAPCLPTGDAG